MSKVIKCVPTYFTVAPLFNLFDKLVCIEMSKVNIFWSCDRVREMLTALRGKNAYVNDSWVFLTLKDNKGIRAASITKSCASYIDNNGVVLENLIANEVGRLYNSLNAGKKDK